MKNYDYYKKMFVPGDTYSGRVTKIFKNIAHVRLSQGAEGVVHAINVGGEILNLCEKCTYEFKIIGFDTSGKLSLALTDQELILNDIHPHEYEGTVITGAHNAIAIKCPEFKEVLVLRPPQVYFFLDYIDVKKPIGFIMYSASGKKDDLKIYDLRYFYIRGKYINMLDYTRKDRLSPEDDVFNDDLVVGKLVEVCYDNVSESYFALTNGLEVYVEKQFLGAEKNLFKTYLARLLRFYDGEDEGSMSVELLTGWN